MIFNNNCEIYFNSDRSLVDLISELNNILLGELEDDCIAVSKGNLYFDENSDYDGDKLFKYPDGFLYFKFILSVELAKKEVLMINEILNWFWVNNIPAIASCDYENELLKKGGYRDKTIPFPVLKSN